MLRDLALKQDNGLTEVNGLGILGKIANGVAGLAAFEDYRARKSDNTLRRQDADLRLFAEFLQEKGVEVGDLASDPKAWAGVTWGLVAAFQYWQLARGYAVNSVNVRISTIKTYSKLSFKAGVLSAEVYALIRAVEGYSQTERKRIDEKREAAGVETRRGHKKERAVKISAWQAGRLKKQPDTPQGRRDRLLMCLLLDHGLRISEVTGLLLENFDLETGVMTFYRKKTDKIEAHKLTGDTLRAALDYIRIDNNKAHGPLLKGSMKTKGMDQAELLGGMSERAIFKRVEKLGKMAGVDGLSPHDCRHYAATRYAKTKGLRELMDIFGWTSPAMAARYIESATVISPED